MTTGRPKQKLKKRYDRPIMLYMAYTVASEANFQREDGPLPMHVVEPAATRKTKGKPVLGEEEQIAMLTLRDALAEARLAEQRIWNEVKAQIRAAVEGGATYAAIGEALGITKARVYQLSSGKRSSGSRDSKLDDLDH